MYTENTLMIEKGKKNSGSFVDLVYRLIFRHSNRLLILTLKNKNNFLCWNKKIKEKQNYFSLGVYTKRSIFILVQVTNNHTRIAL